MNKTLKNKVQTRKTTSQIVQRDEQNKKIHFLQHISLRMCLKAATPLFADFLSRM